MVGFVVVSHSYNLAEELIKLANEMNQYDFKIINGSYVEGKHFGSNPMEIKDSIKRAMTDKGVIIFTDLGSSILNTNIAIEFLQLDDEDISNIKIANCPIVEGLIAAVSMNDKNATVSSILEELKEIKNLNKE